MSGSAPAFSADALAFLPVRALRAALAERTPERALAAGAAVGRAFAAFGGRACDVARINLGLAFPHASVDEREQLLDDAFANLGRSVAEIALLQGRQCERLLDAVRLDGDEWVAEAEASSPTGGFVVLTAHYGTWDLYVAAMARAGHRLTVVHRGFRSTRLDAMWTAVRTAGGGDLQELRMGPRAAFELIAALKQGRKCILLLDQNASADEGVFVPFFSRLACTRSAPAVIAMRAGVPVLPVFGHRDENGLAHVLRVGEPLALEAGRGDVRDPAQHAAIVRNVARMNAAIEAQVRSAPEHWLWAQRRWRTRPAPAEGFPPDEGEPVYPARRGVLRAIRKRAGAWVG